MPNRRKHLLAQDMHRVVSTLQAQEDYVTPYRDDFRGLLDNHGKMVRASLVLIFSYTANDTHQSHHDAVASERAVTGAAAIEMLHLATLVHDDVLDNAPIRRGKPAVHTLRGNKVAIYLGDLILARYMELMAQVAPNTAFVEEQSRTIGEIVSGDLLQESARHHIEAGRANYERAITGKTAALFRLACTTGLKLADPAPSEAALAQAAAFGENLGVAFQIIDDIGDFDVAHDTGKPKLEDIRDGIYTLPVLLAAEADPVFASEVLTKDDPQAVLAYLNVHPQFIEQSKQAARDRVSTAQQALTDPSYPAMDTDTRDLLGGVTDKVLATL